LDIKKNVDLKLNILINKLRLLLYEIIFKDLYLYFKFFVTTYMKLNQALLNDGFVLVKDVISAELIDNIRNLGKIHSSISGIKKHNGVRQPHAFRFAPFIVELFSEKKLIKALSESIGSSDWFITNHADLHSNALSGWHKDDGMSYGNGGYFREPIYHIDNPFVFKCAIYFQDHIDFNDGLTVIKGSHRSPEIKKGLEEHVSLKKGDIIIFDPRLSHTGQISPIPSPLTKYGEELIKKHQKDILKIQEDKQLDKSLKEKKSLNLFRKISGTRQSIFFTFARDDKYSRIFAIENMKRQLMELEKNTPASLQPRLQERIKDYGVKLIDDCIFWKEEKFIFK